MNGEVHDPMELVLLIHNLNLPKEISKLIIKFAVSIMYCSKCGTIIQKDYKKLKNLGWAIDDSSVKCIKCLPNLQELYQNKKLRN